MRSASRINNVPTFRAFDFGFRPARTIAPWCGKPMTVLGTLLEKLTPQFTQDIQVAGVAADVPGTSPRPAHRRDDCTERPDEAIRPSFSDLIVRQGRFPYPLEAKPSSLVE